MGTRLCSPPVIVTCLAARHDACSEGVCWSRDVFYVHFFTITFLTLFFIISAEPEMAEDIAMPDVDTDDLIYIFEDKMDLDEVPLAKPCAESGSVNQESRLLSLPAEIRNMIYEYVLTGDDVPLQKREFCRRKHPLDACKQIRSEAEGIFYAGNDFIVDATAGKYKTEEEFFPVYKAMRSKVRYAWEVLDHIGVDKVSAMGAVVMRFGRTGIVGKEDCPDLGDGYSIAKDTKFALRDASHWLPRAGAVWGQTRIEQVGAGLDPKMDAQAAEYEAKFSLMFSAHEHFFSRNGRDARVFLKW
jgi:hypothetical protein